MKDDIKDCDRKFNVDKKIARSAKRLTLIDASSILYRSFFALPPMTSSSGEATQALYGFAKFLLKWCRTAPGEYCLIAFDGINGKQRRVDLSPAYKAHRQKAPPELISQMDAAPQLCTALCLPHLQLHSEEADDVIASACRWAEKEGAEIFIHSQDKDLLQLVSATVRVLATHKDQLLFDPRAVKDLYGVTPEQLGDWLALVGDASDNIPGVAGIGPKKATQLLQQFGDLESLLAHAAQVPGKIGEKLRASQEQARLSRQLVALFDDLNHAWKWENLLIKSPHLGPCRALFERWSFQSLLKQLPEGTDNIEPASDVLPQKTRTLPSLHLQIVENRQQWELLRAHLDSHQSERVCTLDLQDRIIPGVQNRPSAIGIATEGCAWICDLRKLEQNELTLPELLLRLFPQNGRVWVTDRAKDWYHLRHEYPSDETTATLLSQSDYFDVIVGGYLLQRNEKELVGAFETKKESQLFDPSALVQRLSRLFQLGQTLPNQLRAEGLFALFDEIEKPLVPILALMEHRGILIDAECLAKERLIVRERLAQLESAIWLSCGEQFNLNSPKQLAQILFEHLKLAPVRKIATGFSTDAAALEGLKDQHPAVPMLLEYRMLEKLRSTYLDALPQNIGKSTGRIHPKFMQTVTSTGRLSCQEPNLQNIPIRSEWGERIRSAFIAEKGHCLIAADYSQIELRLMAHFSKDEAMIEAFCQNRDIHALTAARIFDVPIDRVTKQQRAQAKTVNFAVIYGQQAFGLASQLGITHAQADSFIKAYFARYPGVARYIRECKSGLEGNQTVKTLFGRKRGLGKAASGVQKRLAQRLAINSPIQGTGADLMKIAMIEVQRQIDRWGMRARMILQIHDELLFECPFDEVDRLKELCRPAMENIADLLVPLVINVSVGNNWSEC